MARSPAIVSSTGIEPVGLDRQLAAVQRDHQFAEVLAVLPGLHHRRAAIDDDRLVQFGVAVGADDHVDAGHRRGQPHVLAAREAPVLVLLQPAMAERDDHVHLLRLAQQRHHLARGLDRIGELHRAGAAGIELRLLAEQPEDAEAYAAALDHEVAAHHAILGQALEPGQRRVVGREIGIRRDHRRNASSLGGHRDGLRRAVRPEIEIMIAERRGVATHSGQQLQFGRRSRGWRRRTRSPCCSRPHPAPAPGPDSARAAFRFAISAARRANPPRVVSSLSVNGV